MILLGLGCADPSEDRRRYREGLASGVCEAIEDAALRDDCRVVAAERGVEGCGAVSAEAAREECWFRLAESREDASLCRSAGRFADACALHVLSQGFVRWPEGRRARPGEREDEVAARIAAAGLAPGDMRPWSAWYRFVLGGHLPLDRAACDAVVDPARREACWHTGIAVYQDLLNHARDTRIYPCDGGPLPTRLSHPPDPELDAVRAARTDLCPR